MEEGNTGWEEEHKEAELLFFVQGVVLSFKLFYTKPQNTIKK